jgi:hypothetical protein
MNFSTSQRLALNLIFDTSVNMPNTYTFSLLAVQLFSGNKTTGDGPIVR